jgi:hypothetical protein
MYRKSKSVFTAIILNVVYILCATVRAQEVLNEVTVNFLAPEIFRCGESVSWNRLSYWEGEGAKCGSGILYSVVGEVPEIRDGTIRAKIVVPEDQNSEWAPFNGESQKITNHRFEVQFCITTRASVRPMWFQVYSNSGEKVGEICRITLIPD